MEELIRQLQEETGLGVEQITLVVAGVMDVFGDKLPGPIADQVKNVLGDGGGEAGGGGGGGDLIDAAKNMRSGLSRGDKG